MPQPLGADAPTEPTTPDAKTGPGDTPDLAAEVEKWKALAQKHEARAKSNADKAQRLDELEASSKSDIEKLTAKVEQLVAENATAKTEALRLRIAASHGISAEDAEMFLTGDEESMTAQAKRLAEAIDVKKRNGTVVPGEGRQPTSSAVDDRVALLRDLTARRG